jgi:hypothetical protein
MRLLESVLARLTNTKRPQRKFFGHLLGLMLMLPGPMTFRNLSRYSAYHEKSFARWLAREFDWVELNYAAITQVVPTQHEQALVMDASFIAKSGQYTYGVDRFWNGCAGHAEKGLAISVLAWLDVTANQGILSKFHGGSGHVCSSALLFSLINCASEGSSNFPLTRSWMSS